MKKRLTNNAGLKIVSVILAILLWLIVVNISNPTMTETYTGISVSVTDTDIVTNNGETYDIDDSSKTVSVTVTAKRSVLESIKESDIQAEASMKNLMEGYLIPIDIKIDGYEGLYQSAVVKPVNLQVSIEETASNKFPVTVVTSGEVQDGYVIGSTTAKPSAITISGAKSVITSISKVVAKIDVSGLSDDASLAGELLVYDEDNNVLDQSQLTTNLGTGGVKVRVDLYSTKSVGLNFRTAGVPKSGYVCSDISYEPETIQVAGEEELIDSLDSIDIPAMALDISGEFSSVEKTIDISEYLPKGVLLVDEETKNIAVTAVIEKMGTKTISIPAGAVMINNAPSDLTASFKSADDVELNFTGAREVLDTLSADEITASVDLSAYKKEGAYAVPLKVEAPEGCSLSEDVKLTVILMKP